MTTRYCSRCKQPYFVSDTGIFGHACPDGQQVIAGTAWEPFDFCEVNDD